MAALAVAEGVEVGILMLAAIQLVLVAQADQRIGAKAAVAQQAPQEVKVLVSAAPEAAAALPLQALMALLVGRVVFLAEAAEAADIHTLAALPLQAKAATAVQAAQ